MDPIPSPVSFRKDSFIAHRLHIDASSEMSNMPLSEQVASLPAILPIGTVPWMSTPTGSRDTAADANPPLWEMLRCNPPPEKNGFPLISLTTLRPYLRSRKVISNPAVALMTLSPID